MVPVTVQLECGKQGDVSYHKVSKPLQHCRRYPKQNPLPSMRIGYENVYENGEESWVVGRQAAVFMIIREKRYTQW
jgi:hypothetical protein